MSERERMMKLLAADAATLAKVDAILDGRGDATDDDADLRLIRISDAAKRLGLSRPTIYRLIAAGRLETIFIAGAQRIRLRSLVAFANGQSGAAEK